MSFLSQFVKEWNSRNDNISNDELIVWSTERKLNWEDFKGTPDSSSVHKANTGTRIMSKTLVFTDNLIECEMYTVFDTKRSWVKEKSEKLLLHEQLHFDIAELNMRILRKRFESYKLESLDRFNKDKKKMFQETLEDIKRMNSKYDEETEHGLIIKNQLEWEIEVKKSLSELESYSSIKVVLKK